MLPTFQPLMLGRLLLGRDGDHLVHELQGRFLRFRVGLDSVQPMSPGTCK